MKFENGLIPGTILKRYKRFFADVELENGRQIVVAHVANTGSMKTCWKKGYRVLCSYHDDPNRKLKYGLQLINNGKTWILVNTSLPNKIAREAIQEGTIKELQGYPEIKSEVKTGESRIDIMLKDGERECYVEVKNVTLMGDDGTALFPDSVSTRGQKHLRELMTIKQEGRRACMLYVISRQDVDKFAPAAEIDPEYTRLLKEAADKGVEILAYQVEITPKEVRLARSLPVVL